MLRCWFLRFWLFCCGLASVSSILYYFFFLEHLLTIENSYHVLVQTIVCLWRRIEICNYPGRKPGRRCHGMERSKRVGNRARQCQEQKEIRSRMGLRTGNCGHEHEEALRARMERKLGESRRD